MRHGRLLMLLTIIALLSVAVGYGRLAVKGQAQGYDFDQFWYAGHFLWQGDDPYRAFLERRNLKLPIHFIDGEEITSGNVSAFKPHRAVPNAAPTVLLLAPFSRLSWPVASGLWAFFNLIIVPVVVLICLRLFKARLSVLQETFLVTVAFALMATRQNIEVGQTSLLILLCTVLSLFFSFREGRRRPWLSGVFLGIGLSKPLVGFPLFLIYLFLGRFKEAAVSVGVQAAGIAAIAGLGGSTVWEVCRSYLRIFGALSNLEKQDGMYLTAGLLKGFLPYSYAVLILGLLVLGAYLVRSYRRLPREAKEDVYFQLAAFNIISFANLLTLYHRRYDWVMGIIFLVLVGCCWFGLKNPFIFSRRERRVLYGTTAAVAAVWIFPFYLVLGPMPYRYLFNIATLAALGLSLWMMSRTGYRGRDGLRAPACPEGGQSNSTLPLSRS